MDVAALANLSALLNLWGSPVLTELHRAPGRANEAIPVWTRWGKRRRPADSVVQG